MYAHAQHDDSNVQTFAWLLLRLAIVKEREMSEMEWKQLADERVLHAALQSSVAWAKVKGFPPWPVSKFLVHFHTQVVSPGFHNNAMLMTIINKCIFTICILTCLSSRENSTFGKVNESRVSLP